MNKEEKIILTQLKKHIVKVPSNVRFHPWTKQLNELVESLDPETEKTGGEEE